jgi:hypothetical protein
VPFNSPKIPFRRGGGGVAAAPDSGSEAAAGGWPLSSSEEVVDFKTNGKQVKVAGKNQRENAFTSSRGILKNRKQKTHGRWRERAPVG